MSFCFVLFQDCFCYLESLDILCEGWVFSVSAKKFSDEKSADNLIGDPLYVVILFFCFQGSLSFLTRV